MGAQTYTLQFGGYWREPNLSGIPAQSGIYGVYAATYNPLRGTVSLNRLLYIGESDNVQARIRGHEKWSLWRSKLRAGEELCFNTAPISSAGARQRTEAAMIFEHKPSCNDEYLYSFPFDQTKVMTSGTNALMKAQFTVYRTPATILGNALFGVGAPRR